MTGATIDHLVSVVIFLAAILIFIGLFNQTIQTAVTYQQHRYLATKCSDMLDNILLNPGSPQYWGLNNTDPTSFGLQDPEFTQYRLSPFSLMRLDSSMGTPVFYSKTGLYYSNTTTGFGESLLVPYDEIVDSKTAASLLGINGSYGFSLTFTPTVAVSISEVQVNPLKVRVQVAGSGYPFAHSNISYCLIKANATGAYPSYTIDPSGTNITDDQGLAVLSLGTFDETSQSYALIVYAHTNGLVGVGCYEHLRYTENYAVPLISDLNSREVLIANSWDIVGGAQPCEIAYNATFVLLTEDFTLREMSFKNGTERAGTVGFGMGQAYGIITNSTDNPGILVVSYMKAGSSNDSGIVLMPWGINSMALSLTFGDDPNQNEWVTTDIRQVTVGNIAYQAKLALWSLGGYQVTS
jgi:hypothetical protein